MSQKQKMLANILKHGSVVYRFFLLKKLKCIRSDSGLETVYTTTGAYDTVATNVPFVSRAR